MISKVILTASLALIISASANAQVEFRHISTEAGFDLGLVIPDGSLHPSIGWGGLMDFGFSMGAIGEFHIFPNLEFWVSGYRPSNRDLTHLTVVEMMINSDFRYYFPLPERIKVRPFVGNGFSFDADFQKYDYDYNPNDYRDTDFELGFNIFGGVDFPFTDRNDRFC